MINNLKLEKKVKKNINFILFIVEKLIKLYKEPQFTEEGKFIKEILTEDQKEIQLSTNLKEGVLKTNIGVPVCIIVNKSDIVSQQEEKKFYENNSKFILKHIRQIAISYGAAIAYVSGKEKINLTLLYDYICNVLFGFDLLHYPNLDNNDCFFIPAGYDSTTTLEEFDIEKDLNTFYDDKFPSKNDNKKKEEEEIVCEETNAFLNKIRGEKGKKEFFRSRTITSEKTKNSPEHKVGGKFDMFKNKNENNNINVQKENKGASGFKPKNTNSEEKNTNNVEPVNNNNNNEKTEEQNVKNSKPTTNTTIHHTTGKAGGANIINKQTREAMLKKLGLKKVKK